VWVGRQVFGGSGLTDGFWRFEAVFFVSSFRLYAQQDMEALTFCRESARFFCENSGRDEFSGKIRGRHFSQKNRGGQVVVPIILSRAFNAFSQASPWTVARAGRYSAATQPV
jgi:hypothetical protein